MDEKWSFAFVSRTHQKSIASNGIAPRPALIYHKNYKHKLLCIVIVGFIPFSNDITQGGKTIKINTTRVGKMIKAKKDSYSVVYNEESGTMKFLKIPENKMKVKGETYFEDMDITGSTTKAAIKNKFPMLDFHETIHFPDLDKHCAQESQGGAFNVKVRYVYDDANVHTGKKMKTALQKLLESRDWMLVQQLPQSPLTKILDSTVFPSISKSVGSKQSLLFGGLALRKEKPWSTVKLIWDNMPLECIARGFSYHHQIASAIFKYQGNNNYLYVKKGLHVGSRRMYYVDEDGNGMHTFPVDNNDGPSLQKQICETSLKYKTHGISNYGYDSMLNSSEKILHKYMNKDEMDDELCTCWDSSDIENKITRNDITEVDTNLSDVENIS